MATSSRIPELLMPVGNWEKLQVALNYGADAVYLSGQKFGMRTRSDNFSLDELKAAAELCQSRGVRMYVTLNGFLHDQDLEELPAFVRWLEQIGVNAVIVSDWGVIKTVQQHSQIPIHLSTQASCLNASHARFWKKQGIKRLVLGREVSLEAAAQIRNEVDIEIEVFIHGSMCMAYSGNCVISNYTAGRDSNRGGCSHSCRFEYSFHKESGETTQDYFLSSKDLNGLALLPMACKLGLDSLKVEGRMKGPLYVATLAKAYREARDLVAQGQPIPAERWQYWEQEIRKIPHREYTTGNLVSDAGIDSVARKTEELDDYRIVGQLMAVYPEQQFALVEVKNAFNEGEVVEILSRHRDHIVWKAENFSNVFNEKVTRTKPNTLIKIPWQEGMNEGDFLRQEWRG